MSDPKLATGDFDPYLKWLGIPIQEQPPNHYRLLGIELFTEDADIIQNAADARMHFLRTFRTGKRVLIAERLQNEVSAAKICLLDAKKKPAYDAQLRPAMAPPPAALPQPVADVPADPVQHPKPAVTKPATPVALQTVTAEPIALSDFVRAETSRTTSGRKTARRAQPKVPTVAISLLASALVAILGIGFFLLGKSVPEKDAKVAVVKQLAGDLPRLGSPAEARNEKAIETGGAVGTLPELLPVLSGNVSEAAPDASSDEPPEEKREEVAVALPGFSTLEPEPADTTGEDPKATVTIPATDRIGEAPVDLLSKPVPAAPYPLLMVVNPAELMVYQRDDLPKQNQYIGLEITSLTGPLPANPKFSPSSTVMLGEQVVITFEDSLLAFRVEFTRGRSRELKLIVRPMIRSVKGTKESLLPMPRSTELAAHVAQARHGLTAFRQRLDIARKQGANQAKAAEAAYGQLQKTADALASYHSYGERLNYKSHLQYRVFVLQGDLKNVLCDTALPTNNRIR